MLWNIFVQLCHKVVFKGVGYNASEFSTNLLYSEVYTDKDITFKNYSALSGREASCIYIAMIIMFIFLISLIPTAEPVTSELIDTAIFHNLALGPV